MAQRIVGLDLGSHSIKVIHVEPRGRAGDFEVVAYEEVPLPPAEIGEGEPLPLDARHEIALKDLDERGLLAGDLVVTGLPGDAAAVRTLKFPFSDPRKIEQALPFELESEIPFDIEDVVYAWSLLSERGNRAGGEFEVLVAFARREAVADHLDLLARAGVDPRHVEFDALALDDLFDGVFRAGYGDELEGGHAPSTTPGGTVIESGPDAPQPGIAIVDIGHLRTSVCVLAKERVVSAHTILHGGADATRALAKELALPPEEAERGKRKEAFIEVTGAVAQFPEQVQISDILKRAYAPIARRLRQVFQASVSSSRVRVTKVLLVGGGSRVLNLDRHLAEVLNVRVERGREVGARLGGVAPLGGAEAAVGKVEAPEAALALGYALSGLVGDKSRARIDFRTGEFAWKGDLDFVKERAVSLGVWAAVVLAFFAVGGVARAWVLGDQEEALLEKQSAACESILGTKVESASRCLAMIQERIQGQSGDTVPDWSAVDTYLEVSKRMPPPGTLTRKVSELDINPERVRLKATTQDFDDVDKIVSGLQAGRCFESVDKGKARNVKDGVEFDAIVRIDCAKAPGEPEPETTAAASDDDSATRPSPASRRDAIRERARARSAELQQKRLEAAAGDPAEAAAVEKAAAAVKARMERRGGRPTPEELEKAKRLESRDAALRDKLGDSPVRGPSFRDAARPSFELPGRRPLRRLGPAARRGGDEVIPKAAPPEKAGAPEKEGEEE